MRDLDLKLAKPYSRDGEIKGSEVTFSCKFDEPIRALKFVHELNELCARYLEGKEVE